ncbi:MAG TPA: ABC transporter permease [Acidobacteriota bacterium]|nr:ABC transporter permease [Acidobacteriota bacterium]
MNVLLSLLKRSVQLLLVAFLVTSATFALSSWIPGDFFSKHFMDPAMSPESIAQLRHRYGLDQSVPVQYFHWLANSLRLDLGFSLLYQQPVFSVVLDALRKTLWLGIPALILGFGGGVAVGTLHGMHRNRPFGHFMDLVSSVALSLPSIVLGISALLFAAHTGWFPLGSMSSVEGQQSLYWGWLIDRLHHLALPVCCLSVPIFASVERIQYTGTRDCLESLFLRSAQARGLSGRNIFLRHLLVPSLNPVLSTSGPILGGVLSGSLVLEIIFSWPGLGKVTYDALFNNDLFLILGCVVASSVLLVAGNLLADILLLVMDPRTRETARGSNP